MRRQNIEITELFLNQTHIKGGQFFSTPGNIDKIADSRTNAKQILSSAFANQGPTKLWKKSPAHAQKEKIGHG